MINQLFGYPLYKTKLQLDPRSKKQLLGQIIDNYNKNITYTQPRWGCDVFSTFEKFNDDVNYSCVIDSYSNEYVKLTQEFGLFEHQYKITGIWNNVYRKNYFQEAHDHVGYKIKEQYLVWFSGVHFLKLSKEHPKLIFHNPGHSPYQTEMFPTAMKTIDKKNLSHSFLSLTVEPTVEEDDLILFPSTLSHSVGLQRVDDLRVTVSFNIGIKVNAED